MLSFRSLGKSTFFLACLSVWVKVSTGQTVISSPPAQNFGQVPVNGASATPMSLGYAFSNPSVVFSLAYSSDFTIAAPKCTTAGNTTCTAAVTFSPQSAGLRRNAVLVKDASGHVLATTLLYGVGLAGQVAVFPGTISTVAGTGAWNYSGDGKLASLATLRNPQGLAIDSLGNLYIADSVNQVVRQVSAATGKISTVVGSGMAGYAGDGALALNASLNTPTAVALDGAGNIFIADEGNNVVRCVNAFTQRITTVAGGGSGPSGKDGLGDGALATGALLSGPTDIAIDGIGNLYIADSYHGTIRMVDAVTGIISVVAGGGNSSGSDGFGDGALAINARLNDPMGIGLDTLGNLYIADSGDSLVRRVDVSTGIITAIAGNGRSGYSGDLGLAVNATLGSPSAVRIDPAGNIYIADQGKNVVRLVNVVSGIIATVVGTGAQRYSGDGGLPAAAGLANPYGMAFDGKGNLYIADFTNNAIRKVTAAAAGMTFPNTLVGQASAAQQVTVLNSGNQPLSLSGVSQSAGFSQQMVGVSDCSATTVLAPGAYCVAAIAFVPSKAGVASGNLVITTNSTVAGSSAVTVPVSGTAATGAVPQIAFSATTLAFGNQTMNTTSTARSFTLSNTGSAPLYISSFRLDGPDTAAFSVTSTCQTVVTPGASCSVSVVFSPVRAGGHTTSLAVVDNLASSPQTMAITGTGTGTPQVALGSSALQFGSQSIGGSAVVKNVRLSNTGSGPLSIASVALSGPNAADFTLNSSCGSTVVAGASCSFAVSFSPRVQGLRTAILALSSDGTSQTQTVTVTGTGSFQASPAVWRPSNGTWFLSATAAHPAGQTMQWGLQGDIPVPGDYDGDGKVDFAVFRPSNGSWYIVPSSTSTYYVQQWGLPGDIPVAGDYDGDGKTDVAVYRPSGNTWYITSSKTGVSFARVWAVSGDTPVPGDYDGDGKTDLAVFRPSNGSWYILPSSTSGNYVQQWGLPGDAPVPADYDGDGKMDAAVYRPSTNTWFIIPSSTGIPYSFSWGLAGDMPVPCDYDGDGKADIAVWRPSNGTWYVLPSKTQSGLAIQFGLPGDIPLTSRPN